MVSEHADGLQVEQGRRRSYDVVASTALSIALSVVLGVIVVVSVLEQQTQPPTAAHQQSVAAAPVQAPSVAARAVRLPQPPAQSPVLAAPAPVPVKPKPPAQAHVTDAASEADGRVLLRVLEHGKGPSIEIAWPERPSEQAKLYERFRSCFGMHSAVMDDQGRLFRSDGAPGAEWQFNSDLFSGFVRQASGMLVATEHSLVASIRAHHGLASGGVVVRLFPRRIDARLLGGLQRVLGAGYSTAKTVQAHYQIHGQTVTVRSLRMDGQAVAGTITLKAGAGC